MAQILVLSDVVKRAQEIAAFASKKENWYDLDGSDWIPGNRPEFVLNDVQVRAVFSWTRAHDKKLYKHLTISVPRREPTLPNPIFVWTVAHAFGFDGVEPVEGVVQEPGKDWAINLNRDEGCIVVLQEVAS